MSIEDEGGAAGKRKHGTWFTQCQQYAIHTTIDNEHKRKIERQKQNLDRFSHCTQLFIYVFLHKSNVELIGGLAAFVLLTQIFYNLYTIK